MKKLLLLITLITASISANAAFNNNVPFELYGEPKFEVERPFFDMSYSELHKKTLEEKDRNAYFEGGLRYYYGFSKRLDIPFPKDYAAAAMWFYESGMKDHELASYFLGNMYLKGQSVKQDYKTAIWWFNKSKERGFNHATYMLANIYYELSQNKDLAESYQRLYLEYAIKNYEELLKVNYPQAFYNRAIIKLRNKDLTRFVLADVNELLQSAFDLYLLKSDKESCYDILKVMAYYRLEGHRPSEMKFNQVFN